MIGSFIPVLMGGELAERLQVVAEVRSWIGTPYHATGAMIKGAGCDCSTLIYAVYRACGLVPDEDIGVFATDWFCHAKEETYMRRIVRHAYKTVQAVSWPTLEAKPGSIALTRAVGSRVYNHGGIVTKWPMVVHALQPHVAEVNASTHWIWANKEVTIFDHWVKA